MDGYLRLPRHCPQRLKKKSPISVFKEDRRAVDPAQNHMYRITVGENARTSGHGTKKISISSTRGGV